MENARVPDEWGDYSPVSGPFGPLPSYLRDQFSMEFRRRLNDSGKHESVTDASHTATGRDVPPGLDYLLQRRLEDFQRTRRRWPGDAARHADERELIYRGAIGLGEIDPSFLAVAQARRYVRSSRVIDGSEADRAVDRTDITAIFFYGLGLTILPLDATPAPQTLAVYDQAGRALWMDYRLMRYLPKQKRDLDSFFHWRQAIDTTVVARMLVAWACALRLCDTWAMPLHIGFEPVKGGAPIKPTFDTQNRWMRLSLCVAELLCPQDRLRDQLVEMGLRPFEASQGDWRRQLVERYGTRRDAELLGVLAEYNICPALLVEQQLDVLCELPPRRWDAWMDRLVRDVPGLKERALLAGEHFGGRVAGQRAEVLLTL